MSVLNQNAGTRDWFLSVSQPETVQGKLRSGQGNVEAQGAGHACTDLLAGKLQRL